MKKLISLVALFGVVLASSVWAAPVDVSLVEVGKWEAGPEINLLLGKDIENSAGGSTWTSEVEQTQFLSKASYGILEWLTGTLRLGVADGKVEGPATGEVDFDTDPAYGAGVTARLYDQGSWQLFSSFQLFSVADPDSENGSIDADWNEWQAALVVVRPFSVGSAEEPQVFRPYLGVTVGDVDADSRSGGVSINGEADDLVGLVGGIGTRIGAWNVGVQGRVISEEAITVSGSYKF